MSRFSKPAKKVTYEYEADVTPYRGEQVRVKGKVSIPENYPVQSAARIARSRCKSVGSAVAIEIDGKRYTGY